MYADYAEDDDAIDYRSDAEPNWVSEMLKDLDIDEEDMDFYIEDIEDWMENQKEKKKRCCSSGCDECLGTESISWKV